MSLKQMTVNDFLSVWLICMFAVGIEMLSHFMMTILYSSLQLQIVSYIFMQQKHYGFRSMHDANYIL